MALVGSMTFRVSYHLTWHWRERQDGIWWALWHQWVREIADVTNTILLESKMVCFLKDQLFIHHIIYTSSSRSSFDFVCLIYFCTLKNLFWNIIIKSWARHCTHDFWQHFCSNQLPAVESQNKQAYHISNQQQICYIEKSPCSWTTVCPLTCHTENRDTPSIKIQSGSVTMVRGVVTLVLWLDWGRKKKSVWGPKAPKLNLHGKGKAFFTGKERL